MRPRRTGAAPRWCRCTDAGASHEVFERPTIRLIVFRWRPRILAASLWFPPTRSRTRRTMALEFLGRVLQREVVRRPDLLTVLRQEDVERQVAQLDHRALGQNDRALDDVL